MIFFKQFDNAHKLINKYFDDKVDKGDHPYKDHLIRVCNAIEEERRHKCYEDKSCLSLYYYKCEIVALLHDILEDTECTIEELKDNGFDDEIINAIVAITRKKEETYYLDFIERVSKNDLASLVKNYDLEDNMDIKRLNKFDEYEQKRLRKYFYCWQFLNNKISIVECNNLIHPDRKFR